MAMNTSASINRSNTLVAREKDLAFQFEKQWDLLRKILGIVRLVKKKDGEELTYKTAKRIGNLNIQDQEGQATTGTQYEVVAAGTYKISLERAEKETTAEAVLEWGVDIALSMTDAEFVDDLQYNIMDRFYGFLSLGTLVGNRPTFLSAISAAKGSVLNRAASLHKRVGEIVGFIGITDLYNYLGEQQVTLQTAFGLQYVENFLGFRVLILLPDTLLSNKVIATPMNNIIAYYVDPADEGLRKLGLEYTVTGETNLIGFATDVDYKHGTGTTFSAMGLTLFAERIDFISVITISSSAGTKDAVAVVAESTMADTKSPATGVSDGKRKNG